MTTTPAIKLGYEGSPIGPPVLAVGYFAPDDTEVICTHPATPRGLAHAVLCLEAEDRETTR